MTKVRLLNTSVGVRASILTTAYMAGNYLGAIHAYAHWLQEHPADAVVLCNLAAAQLAAGHPEASASARRAAMLLRVQLSKPTPSSQQQRLVRLYRKATYRHAAALQHAGDTAAAVDVLRGALAATGPLVADVHLVTQLHSILHDADSTWLAQECAALVAEAEKPHRVVSERDGVLLRPVMPPSQRLQGVLVSNNMCSMLWHGRTTEQDIAAHLHANFALPEDASVAGRRHSCAALVAAWTTIKRRTHTRRAAAALLRALAYWSAHNHVQAGKARILV